MRIGSTLIWGKGSDEFAGLVCVHFFEAFDGDGGCGGLGTKHVGVFCPLHDLFRVPDVSVEGPSTASADLGITFLGAAELVDLLIERV